MGCFLTITSRDFAQLSATMKAGVSVVGAAGASEIKIQVQPTAFNNAREMARQIRRQARTAKITTGSALDASKATPTKQRMQYQVAALSQISPVLANVYLNNIKNTFGAEMRRFGKVDAEPMAKKILEQTNYLDRAKSKEFKVTRSRGIDVPGLTKTNTDVVVEVKFSTQEKDFGKMMNEGAYKSEDYPEGRRQMSNSWLEKVSPGIDIEKTNILGVHINPERETVTIYRRIDSEAKHWKPLMIKPLSDFKL